MSNKDIKTQVEAEPIRPGTSRYSNIHAWVRKQWGKPTKCERCPNPDGRHLEWSNNSGKYLKDRSDWERLCGSCHRVKDLRRTHCSQGHEYTPENSVYRFTKGNQRVCRTCKNAAYKKWWYRGREEKNRYCGLCFKPSISRGGWMCIQHGYNSVLITASEAKDLRRESKDA